MFQIDDLAPSFGQPWFISGYQALERSLLLRRLALDPKGAAPMNVQEVSRFAQAVAASVVDWDLDDPRATRLCTVAGDIEAALAILGPPEPRARRQARLLTSAVLYDLAGIPGTAASSASRDGMPTSILHFFTRKPSSLWGLLHPHETRGDEPVPADNGLPPPESNANELIAHALAEILEAAGASLQGGEYTLSPNLEAALASLDSILGTYRAALSSDLLHALRRAMSERMKASTARITKARSTLTLDMLRDIGAPTAFWPVQRLAIENGLLDAAISSFGLAAPTGTGKTALTRILLADFFSRQRERKALYITPSRALTSEVGKDLSTSLAGLDLTVVALGANLTIDDRFRGEPRDADVLVFTPEKADLLLRVEPAVIAQAGLVIVDEAHHIEQGTRGVLLEFYLWRLRSLVPKDTRIVQLSAVAPNISELVGWLATPENASAVKVDWRAGRLRLGIFERHSGGRGVVKFGDSPPYELFPAGQFPADRDEGLAELANQLSASGVVLVLCTSRSRAEKLAEEIARRRADQEIQREQPATERLDARIERELFAEAPLRRLVPKGVVFHHAGLPPRVRAAVEEVISKRLVNIVCATTTLAEGVNFPFSTVVVESLVGRNYVITPRTLWNIAGRAGRFGVDSEGHCILYRPDLYSGKMRGYEIEAYLSTRLDDIPPVISALASGILEIKESLDEGKLDPGSLESINLSEVTIDGKATERARRIRGLLNVMRVGYVHASTSGTATLDDAAPEFEKHDLLAANQLTAELVGFAAELASRQRRVVRESLETDEELLRIAARIGWSLETQVALLSWLRGLEDWQLRNFGGIVRGGAIVDSTQLGYLIGPVSTRMAEFEGATLGGLSAYIATGWLTGLPLVEIRAIQARSISFDKLLEVIYARIQYMLPWALFGVSELLRYEGLRRGLRLGTGVGDLSLLASEGVPDFDALTLVIKLDMERVDATRLSAAYRKDRGKTDVIGWFRAQDWRRIAGIVRGYDRRRLDPDLPGLWQTLRTGE